MPPRKQELFTLLFLAVGSASVWSQATSARKPPAPKPTPPPVLEGTVKGPDGKLIENALVVARSSSGGYDETLLSARSDGQGRFRLALKRSGLHAVRVEARGLAAWKNEKVRPGSPLSVVLEKGLAIEGIVRDGHSDAPLARARVTTTVGEPLPWEPDTGLAETFTDAKGRYRLVGLPRGLHDVAARAPGYGRASRSGVPAGGRADLYLFAGASLQGVVLAPDGTPVAGAVVRVELDDRPWSRLRPEKTDESGRFEFVGVEPGSYAVVARHVDFAPGITTGVVVERGADVSSDVTLSRGVDVTGRLVGAEDTPVSGRVLVQELNGRAAGWALSAVLRAEAAADGRFRIAGVPPGSHVLAIASPRHATKRVDFAVAQRAVSVDVGDVPLEAGLTIRGHVRDKAANPVADARIMGYQRQRDGGGAPPTEAQSDADGSFLLGGLLPGSYQLHAMASGYAGAKRTAEAGAQSVEVVLEPGGTITGLVVDEAGRTVESYQVVAQPAREGRAARPHFESVGSADGRFRLDDVAEATYVVTVTAPERAPATRSDVKVPAGGSVDVGRIRLARGGRVGGTVMDVQGAPIPGATVSVRGPGEDWDLTGAEPQAISDASGAFEVRGVPAGTAIAVARHAEYAEARSAAFEVDPAREPAEVRIVLLRGGRIEGTASTRDGGPITGSSVRVFPAVGPWDLQMDPVLLRPDGSFTVERVPPGRMQVTLMQAGGGRFTSRETREVEVRDGETSLVEFVLRDILVSGQVRRSGVPAPEMRVQLLRQSVGFIYSSGGPGQGASGLQRLWAVTREDGSFELLANEPGRYTAHVESLDGRLSLPWKDVSIPDADSHVLDLDFSGTTISGLVVDKQTEQPVAQARVFGTPRKPDGAARGGRATSGVDGRFQLELEDGDYRVTAQAEDYSAETIELSVPGVTGDIVLLLSRGQPLEGKVVDAAGRGVANLQVVAASGTVGDLLSVKGTQTLGDGSFTISALAPRPHNVLAGSGPAGFALAAGVRPGESDLVLTLRPSGRVRLFVRGPDGAPVADAYASVTQLAGVVVADPTENPSTDVQGTAEIVVPAGRIQLEVVKDKREASITLDVPEGGTVSAEVTLAERPPGDAR